MTDKLTQGEYAIIGLLVERPSHGYDLERLIKERGMRDWTELAFSSIYYVLKQLEKREIIKIAPQSSGSKSTRKSYAPTSLGFEIHHDMTMRFLGEPHPTFPAVLLGLANWPAVDPQDACAALQQRKTELKSGFENVTAKIGDQPDFVHAMFDYSTSQIKSEIDWIDRTLARLGDT